MLKRIGFFVALLAIGLSFPGKVNAQAGLKLGFVALPQNTWLLNFDDWDAAKDVYEHRLTWGMATGPVFGYNFGDNFGFRMNFLYSLQGQRWTNMNSEHQLVSHKQRLHYMKVPVMIGFNTNTEFSKVIFSFYAGFQANLLLKSQYSNNDQSYVPDQVLWEDVLDYPTDYKKYTWYDYGPVIDVGVDVKLTYNIMANLHFRGDYSLADAENKDAIITRIDNGIVQKDLFWSSDRATTTNITGGLMIGVTYTFTTY